MVTINQREFDQIQFMNVCMMNEQNKSLNQITIEFQLLGISCRSV